jgi:DNA-binding PadR family transcriptional regulator
MQASDPRPIVGSPLRGAVLALLVSEADRPLGAYKVSTLLQRRLGQAWQVSRQSVYGMLDRLVADGLVRRTLAEGGGRRKYVAAEGARRAVDLWMDAPVSREPVRPELQAKIALSQVGDAPRLLRALDDYQRDCVDKLSQSDEAEVPMGSWTGLVINLMRSAVDTGLKAELEWIAEARKWIEEFVAGQSAR